MFSKLIGLAVHGIAASKVEPGMILTAARDIFQTIIDRNGNHHEIAYANEGDQIRVEHSDDVRPGELFVCTNIDNFEEVASVNPHDLDDVLKEYT
ncbi:hypothetical protein MZD04_gp366 [Pseudomonas phage Psa21]|uniref:Uncharacterized protein n=1 Tax=Pseudomonas phage Psa21 TaxID=2530023 RepID=A0A481W5B0_9CAUD|nr:hypothetical protein MZD04_gp366 [Pseudomonas phage Psa21]QBJ02892.1 hypothetical protein PSA21_366 [Pseudomonas phage Psa21]